MYYAAMLKYTDYAVLVIRRSIKPVSDSTHRKIIINMRRASVKPV
jgi:hypothetical protein